MRLITRESKVLKFEISLANKAADVYFDDVRVRHVKSAVLQSQDYYPFGLTFNEYRRESNLLNSLLYNGKESQDESSLGWLDYGARMYMPDLGRWSGMDVMAEKYRKFSSYAYVINKPIVRIDPAADASVYEWKA